MIVNNSAIVVVIVAAFVVGSLGYSPFSFGNQWKQVNPAGVVGVEVPVWKILIELGREMVVAYVLARFAGLVDDVGWKFALSLGLRVWIGSPVARLVGAGLWDNEPWMLSVIHAGDWLVKMLLLASILGLWRK